MASKSEAAPGQWGRWLRSLGGRSLILALIPLLLAATTFGVLIHSVTLSREADDEVQRGLQVLAQIHAAHAALAEAASGVRGFIITRDRAFLQPYERAQGKLRDALRRLERDIREPAQREQLAEISELVDIKLRSLSALALTPPAMDDAQLLADARDNKALLDRLRSGIASMEERENRIIAELRAEQDRVRRVTQAASLFAVLMTFVLASVLSRWFAGSLIRRIRHLRDNARRIGQREALQAFPGKHQDELAELDTLLVQTSGVLEQRLQDLETARRTAEQASQAKTRFLSRTSHELRTPLNAIIGFSRLLREAGGDQARARHVTVIQQSAEHLLQLVNDLLDLSRVEAGQISLTEQAVDLASQVRHALDIVEGRAEARQIGLQQQIPGGLPAARGDAGRILQILINLLDNAVKFSPSQSTVTVSVERSGDDRLALQVRDQGPGIPAAFRAELFRPFSRQDGQAEGVGLGLAISHGLAVAMGGELRYLETRGPGSCFELLLAVANAPAVAATEPPSIPDTKRLPPAQAGVKPRVWLQTDDEAFAVQIEATAKRLGLACHRHSAQTEADDDAGWVIIRDGEHAAAASAIPATSVLATLVRGTPAPDDTEPSAHRIIPTTAPVSNWRLALQEIVNERP